MISIDDFCERHGACQDALEWALASCVDASDAWARLKPEWLIWVATRPGVLTDRELRLFAVFCARQVEHLLTDQRSKDAIDTAERFAKGQATSEELAAASSAAWAAVRGAASSAAWTVRNAAWAAAWAARIAAMDAARAAADSAAWDAARAAAWNATWTAADSAASDAARAAQSDWLRANTTPNFGVEVQS